MTTLGDGGPTVSAVGLGTNTFGRRLDAVGARAVVHAALDAGVTHFDTAALYGGGLSEEHLGAALAGRRDAAFVATKFGWDDGDPAGVRPAVDLALRRLGMDAIDLLYYHRPDGTTPIAETVGAMQAEVEAGRVRALGVSNVDVAQLREAHATAPIAAVQNQYSLLERDADADVLPAARGLGIGFVPYFPLASGLLTGKYRRGEEAPAGARLADREIPAERWDAVERLAAFAAERGHSLHDLAIAALVSTPGMSTVIAGATSPEQVRANAAAADWALDADTLAAIPRA